MRQIRAEQEHHGEREEPCQNRKESRSEKIREESDKSSVDQSGSSIIVHNNVERGEDRIREGIQTTAAKYTERWNIM